MIQISPKAFLFDFDGVICDSEKAHMLSALKVMKGHNLHFSEEYYFEKLFGFDDRALFEHIFEINGRTLTPQILKELIVDKNREFLDIIEAKVIYFDGVIDLMERLSAKNIPLAVVSGALSSEVELCLSKGNLNKYFQFLVCADHVKRSKPDPECYVKAFAKMLKQVPNMSLANCWVIEDSPTGIMASKAAGLSVIGITNTTSKENLSEADLIVSHYREIEIVD